MSGNRRLLLVRSQEDEVPWELPGWDVVPLVVTEVVPVEAPWSGTCDAVVLTSRHAVPWLSRHLEGFAGPIGVAGSATAKRAMAEGFRCIPCRGGGGRAALFALDPRPGMKVLFPCGSRTAGSVEAAAWETRVDLIRIEVYRLEPRPPLPELPGTFDAVAFLSGQMVEAFFRVVPSAFLDPLMRLPAACTDTAMAQLAAHGWVGPLLPMEKNGGRQDLSRLLLKAVLSRG